uniref:Uncharacterized protein n=1 Tax=Gossypium raimondii TaxID=29730 RepID=A0A0D2PRA9_GOSRA|nr:hypothetical protein B456_005G115100 [Gossypium raimondii]
MERFFFLVDYEPPETSNVDGTRTDFIYISNCISTHKAWKILKTTYEGITRVKRSKFQMLITIFENLRMFETLAKFYAIQLLRSRPKRFLIEVIAIEETKDKHIVRVEKLIGSLQTKFC